MPVDIAMSGGRSDPRNAILHQMFSYLGFGERAGSGLYMISSVWKNKNWIKPEMKDELNPNRTILTLKMKRTEIYPNSYPNHYPNNYPILITKIQAKLLQVIEENPSISVKQISLMIDEIKYDAIRWNIAELKRNGALDRIGTTRKGQWIIKNENIEIK